jgi:hypothetical protein
LWEVIDLASKFFVARVIDEHRPAPKVSLSFKRKHSIKLNMQVRSTAANGTGTNVMNTIFGDFFANFRETNCRFIEYQCCGCKKPKQL